MCDKSARPCGPFKRAMSFEVADMKSHRRRCCCLSATSCYGGPSRSTSAARASARRRGSWDPHWYDTAQAAGGAAAARSGDEVRQGGRVIWCFRSVEFDERISEFGADAPRPRQWWVQTFVPDRSDQPFGEAVLPGWSRCGRLVPNAHGAQSTRDNRVIDLVPIADEILWGIIPRKCLDPAVCFRFSRSNFLFGSEFSLLGKIISLLIFAGILPGNRCGTAAFRPDFASKSSQIAEFPVNFPDSRELPVETGAYQRSPRAPARSRRAVFCGFFPVGTLLAGRDWFTSRSWRSHRRRSSAATSADTSCDHLSAVLMATTRIGLWYWTKAISVQTVDQLPVGISVGHNPSLAALCCWNGRARRLQWPPLFQHRSHQQLLPI